MSEKESNEEEFSFRNYSACCYFTSLLVLWIPEHNLDPLEE